MTMADCRWAAERFATALFQSAIVNRQSPFDFLLPKPVLRVNLI
jgi:hypothetical protein